MSRIDFSGRRLCIATKHGKEKVIAPILEEALGVNCFVPEDFDTDQLGTFTGEIARTETPIDAARKKCLWAMEHTGCDLAVASEGSFGNHPTLFFVPADEEFVVLVDRKNTLEIVARHLTTATNFHLGEVTNKTDLHAFAEKAKFPEHALIVKDAETQWSLIVKGIDTYEALNKAFETILNTRNSAFLETDMRAMNNPTRMEAIRKASVELIQKMKSTCPSCDMPGFDAVKFQPGLPCENCKLPTKSTLNAIYHCAHCSFEESKTFPNGKEEEDPMYCDFCNP